MKRTRIAAAALVLAGGTLLAPLTAQADPHIWAVSEGAPVVDGATGMLGQQIALHVEGCFHSNPGTNAIVGEFISPDGDPLNGYAQHINAPATEAGTFDATATIPLDNDLGTFHVRWYCADTVPETIDDENIRWMAPEATLTISSPEPSAAAAATSGGASTSASPATSTVTMTMDPDALPAIDRIGIQGPQAAELKADGDAQFRRDTKGWKSTDADLLRRTYVKSAFKAVGAKTPTPTTIARYAERLANGDLKVSVVESIALTVHDAGYYNSLDV